MTLVTLHSGNGSLGEAMNPKITFECPDPITAHKLARDIEWALPGDYLAIVHDTQKQSVPTTDAALKTLLADHLGLDPL